MFYSWWSKHEPEHVEVSLHRLGLECSHPLSICVTISLGLGGLFSYFIINYCLILICSSVFFRQSNCLYVGFPVFLLTYLSFYFLLFCVCFFSVWWPEDLLLYLCITDRSITSAQDCDCMLISLQSFLLKSCLSPSSCCHLWLLSFLYEFQLLFHQCRASLGCRCQAFYWNFHLDRLLDNLQRYILFAFKSYKHHSHYFVPQLNPLIVVIFFSLKISSKIGRYIQIPYLQSNTVCGLFSVFFSSSVTNILL